MVAGRRVGRLEHLAAGDHGGGAGWPLGLLAGLVEQVDVAAERTGNVLLVTLQAWLAHRAGWLLVRDRRGRLRCAWTSRAVAVELDWLNLRAAGRTGGHLLVVGRALEADHGASFAF